jgi:hypothetical protein
MLKVKPVVKRVFLGLLQHLLALLNLLVNLHDAIHVNLTINRNVTLYFLKRDRLENGVRGLLETIHLDFLGSFGLDQSISS